jgi:hypothetical protein
MLTREVIQERSYRIWEREGRPHGRDADHWRRAELELVAELGRLHDEAKAVVEADAKAKALKAKEPGKRGGRRKTSTAVE